MADAAVISPPRSGSPGKRVTISPGSRPPTRGRTTPSAGDRLTPMPDYLRPVVRSAVKRWKKLHEDHMMGKLVVKREEKKVNTLCIYCIFMILAIKWHDVLSAYSPFTCLCCTQIQYVGGQRPCQPNPLNSEFCNLKKKKENFLTYQKCVGNGN